MKLITALIFFAFIQTSFASIEDLRPIEPNQSVIREDLELILRAANLEDKIHLELSTGSANTAQIQCSDDKVTIHVEGDHQWGQTFYMALTRLGFLFPHPRKQISPSFDQLLEHCGQVYTWKPAVKYHGFHLHTLHPSEWVHGFLLGKTQIALDSVRWMARNQQNIFDLSLLRQADSTIFRNLKAPFALARGFGIHAGIAFGAALHQQNSFKLISLARTFSDRLSVRQIRARLPWILKNLDVSFIDVEMGTSEFTSTNYRRTLLWLNEISEVADRFNVKMVTKVHCSTNQSQPKWGNFNFLPQFANPKVGILPHTVYLYGINDDHAPMYGGKNFHHIRDFMLQEKDKRRTWFYPETSYFIALDIDVPLLLTDYLGTRARDTKFIHDHGIEGQLVFTTGQELGYWLFDWTTALLNNKDFEFDPMIGLKLLGEDSYSWKRILDFQETWFKKKGLLSVVTFPNFGDEIIPGTHHIHPRNSLKKLWKNPTLLSKEVSLIEEAISNIPEDLEIKNTELLWMWEITRTRLHHALATRKALEEPMLLKVHLDEAVAQRNFAQSRMNKILRDHNRYPEALIFEWHSNPTAYPWGYGYPAAKLHYWKREEEQIRRKNFSPFFMNIIDFVDIIMKNTDEEA